MESIDVTKAGRRHYLFIGLLTTAILLTMSYSFYSSYIMINKYSPLVDAAMEIKFELTTAHLWFEENISGDKHESIESILHHIDQATWYARAMIEGGKNAEGTFLPIDAPHLRSELITTLKHVDRFKEITNKRYESIEPSGIGSPIDQEYDALFKKVVNQIDVVETLLQEKVRKEYGRYSLLQVFLFFVVITLSILATLAQFQHSRVVKNHIHDLSEARTKAEDSERWLKTTMNSMGDGVIIADHKGYVTYLNPVASSLTGWLLPDAQNSKVTEVFKIVNEYTKEPVDDPVAMVIRKNVVVGLANHTELISKDGTVWPISDSAAPIFDNENNLRGVVLVFHEITAQKKAEDEKNKLEAQLRQAFKMEAIGTLAGGIAHDFNNTLAIILGNAEMAREIVSSEDRVNHHIEGILTAAGRAKELVKQILSFSRQGKVKKASYDLCHLVEESMKSLRATIPTSVTQTVTYPDHYSSPENEPILIKADSTQIHQLLLNLCVNAVQAMDEQGDLAVTVASIQIPEHLNNSLSKLVHGTYAHLSITDSGPGIGPDILDNIFDPFFTTKDVGQGTGMGLAVVFGIVKEHGGEINVESKLGQGTTFNIYIPVTSEKPEVQAVKRPEILTGNEKILIVDDEEMLLTMTKDLFERQGYAVTATISSLEGLEMVRQHPDNFDLVITDQTMPEMTGTELSKQILQLQPHMPIILCTGYSSKINKEKAREIGIAEFAAKPINNAELTSLVRRLLDGRRT